MFRDVAGRRTMRVHVGEQAYFVKLHEGIGWGEVIKNWLQLKAPIVGASNEYLACEGLAAEDIDAPRVAAFAEQDTVLPRRRSFVLLDELAGYEDLETLGHRWLEAMPDGLTKHRYLRAVAQFARRFHEAGFVHRDFYICHLLVHQSQRQAPQRLAVLDLHRARRFAQLPQRWRLRDLAALLFSTLDLGYSRRDWLRFVRWYTGQPLAQADWPFWGAVLARAERLYKEGQKKGIVAGRYTGS